MDTYGPPLPPGFKLAGDSGSEEECNPPNKKAKIIGPQFPPFLINKCDSDEDSISSEKADKPDTTNIIGPVLPPSLKESEDVEDNQEVYGPLPPQTKVDYNIVSIIEKRAAVMKDKLEMKGTPVAETTQREEWMVIPDTSRRNQLGAISRCLAPGSKIERKETDSYKNPEEDEKTSKELKKYNKSKRAESLVDLHKKKRKKDKKEKKSSESKERKAFDRDEIAVRNFSEKQVNSVIDKAKYLNSRFAPGRSNPYL